MVRSSRYVLYKRVHVKPDLIAWSDYLTLLKIFLFLSFNESINIAKEKPTVLFPPMNYKTGTDSS